MSIDQRHAAVAARTRRPGERGPARRRDPLRAYQRLVVLVDTVAIVLAVASSALLRWWNPSLTASDVKEYAALSLFVVGAWLAVIVFRGGYDRRYLAGAGEEFKRVVSATFVVFGVIAGVSYLFRADVSRAFVLLSLPIGLVLLLLGRWLSRRWLFARRRAGRLLHRTLVIGLPDQAEGLAAMLRQDAHDGFEVVAELAPPSRGEPDLDAWVAGVLDAIESQHVDAVAVAQSARTSSEVVRRLAWGLEGPGVDLLVAPALGDVAGPRLSVRPAAGVPLLHLDEPQLTGPKRLLKRALDLAVAGVAVLVLSPVLLVVAAAVAITSRGPIFFRQQRVGCKGRPFTFLKFRTMVDGAHLQRAEIIGEPDAAISGRYRHDPRVTSVGRVLRRWSLDELPQLFNVLGGSMSLVGPRPMLQEELSLLGDVDHRRHLTKPGLTGLWQISGRKEVAWEDRMRLDLHYVETWSVALDFVIVAKTAKAVLSGHGAY